MAYLPPPYNNIHGKDAYIFDMCPQSQIGDFVEKIFRSFRITVVRNLSIAALFGVCCTAPLFPAKNQTPLDKNFDGAKSVERHENKTKDGANSLVCLAKNPEVEFQGLSIRWL